jgi:hypothetical protein
MIKIDTHCDRRGRFLLAGVCLAGLAAILFTFPGPLGAAEPTTPAEPTGGGPAADAAVPTQSSTGKLYSVPPPPLSDYFPCSMCHEDMEVNRERRELTEEHTDIVLKHDEEHRWCLDCHDANNRDVLRLASGAPVEFTESYRLCGQCHGPKYRDWRAGVHGQRTGFWRGDKQYLLCVHCHDPHSPRFKPLAPMPPPIRPENLH